MIVTLTLLWSVSFGYDRVTDQSRLDSHDLYILDSFVRHKDDSDA